jgi:glycosyltransferase involved in cell wall biosynthesis
MGEEDHVRSLPVVGFDVSILAHTRGGVGRYVRGLYRGLKALADEGEMELAGIDVPASHPGSGSLPEADEVLPTPFYLSVPLLRRIPYRLGWEPFSRARRLGEMLPGCSVYHHCGVQPFHPPGATSVITFHDPSALVHPEWHTEQTVIYAEKEAELIREGSRVLAVSRWSASKAAELLGLEEASVGIARGGVDAAFTPGETDPSHLAQLGLRKDRFLLHVGSYVPRKNIPFLLNAYAAAREKGFDHPLVMVGAERWGSVEVEGGEGVVLLPGLDDRRLISLYRGCTALLLPSTYEGQGLPAMEAAACGCGVICSDATALPETAGGYSVMLDPFDRDAWVRAITALRDPSRISELRARAEAAPRRTWVDCAKDALTFYREVGP